VKKTTAEMMAYLLLRLDFGDRVNVVLVANLALSLPERDHTSLHTHSLELRTTELVRTPCQFRPVDSVVDSHLSAVDAQNLCASLLVGQREFNLPVQTTRTEESGIEDVDTVGGCKHLDAVVGSETVKLVQKLQHGALDFTVTTLVAVETLGADGVKLVNEDD
jgi:hypothetical protein